MQLWKRQLNMYLAFKGEVWDGYIYLGAMHLETFVEVGSHLTVLVSGLL